MIRDLKCVVRGLKYPWIPTLLLCYPSLHFLRLLAGARRDVKRSDAELHENFVKARRDYWYYGSVERLDRIPEEKEGCFRTFSGCCDMLSPATYGEENSRSGGRSFPNGQGTPWAGRFAEEFPGRSSVSNVSRARRCGISQEYGCTANAITDIRCRCSPCNQNFR